MKKKYVKPSIESAALFMEPLMIARSIQNIEGDVQKPIEENNEDGFEAGAKKHYSAWDTWDE